MDRHPVRALPLVAGLVFLGLAAAAYADAAGDAWEAWLAPLLLLAAGAVVVIGALWRFGRGD